jgi:hypothetical protein
MEIVEKREFILLPEFWKLLEGFASVQNKHEVACLNQWSLDPECMEEDSDLQNDSIKVGVPQNIVPFQVGPCEIVN